MRATIVARENILSISLDEPLVQFVERTEKLAQWGDRREKKKRNRTLVLNSIEDFETDMFETVQNSKIAGFAFLYSGKDSAKLDQLISGANVRSLFVLRPQ